jgi:ornithine cyclodeaminase/alanine dehydrogenase
MRYLSEKDLASLGITTAEVVACMERLILAQAQGRAWIAPKTNVATADDRYLMATLAAADDPPFMAVKALLINPANPQMNRNAINASITLMDSTTGRTVALLDGNWVTAVRTAGASALVAKHMANADSSVLALVGCGVQARSHLQAFSDLFPLRQVRAFGRGAKNRDALCELAGSLGMEVVACDGAEDAVSGADLVVTSIPLVPKIEPFLDGDWLKPGVFLSSTDLALPWKRGSMAVFDRIIIDDRQQEASMPEPMLDPILVDGDLVELVGGQVDGRADEKERTAFVFRSVAVGDLALSALAYEKACLHSAGTKL